MVKNSGILKDPCPTSANNTRTFFTLLVYKASIHTVKYIRLYLLCVQWYLAEWSDNSVMPNIFHLRWVFTTCILGNVSGGWKCLKFGLLCAFRCSNRCRPAAGSHPNTLLPTFLYTHENIAFSIYKCTWSYIY